MKTKITKQMEEDLFFTITTIQNRSNVKCDLWCCHNSLPKKEVFACGFSKSSDRITGKKFKFCSKKCFLKGMKDHSIINVSRLVNEKKMEKLIFWDENE